jgi:hypothetical protein
MTTEGLFYCLRLDKASRNLFCGWGRGWQGLNSNQIFTVGGLRGNLQGDPALLKAKPWI